MLAVTPSRANRSTSSRRRSCACSRRSDGAFGRRSGARSTASRTAAAARSPMACTASPIPAERPAAKSASSSSGDTRRMPASGVPQERGSKSAAVPDPSAPSAYSLAQPNRIGPPILEGCARPQGALGGRRHRVGRDAERQAQPSVDEVPEIGERRIRVSKRGIGADPVAVGVVPRLAGAGHAEGGELAERRVEGSRAAQRPGGASRAARPGPSRSRAGSRSARRPPLARGGRRADPRSRRPGRRGVGQPVTPTPNGRRGWSGRRVAPPPRRRAPRRRRPPAVARSTRDRSATLLRCLPAPPRRSGWRPRHRRLRRRARSHPWSAPVRRDGCGSREVPE